MHGLEYVRAVYVGNKLPSYFIVIANPVACGIVPGLYTFEYRFFSASLYRWPKVSSFSQECTTSLWKMIRELYSASGTISLISGEALGWDDMCGEEALHAISVRKGRIKYDISCHTESTILFLTSLIQSM